jgi:N-acetyl-gamma-glutamyl-phosphate reductase
VTAIRAGILGATGYAGAELVGLLLSHPRVEIVWATSEKFAGERLADAFPHLLGITDLKLESIRRLSGFPRVDVVFSCLPPASSMRLIPPLLDSGARVVDLSSDFRFKDPALFEALFGIPHACPHLLGETAYGLTELFREEVRGARLVANPGCFATAVLLGLAPLVRAGLVSGRVVVDAKAGLSGPGRAPRLETHFVEANRSVRALPDERSQGREAEIRLSLLFGATPEIVLVPHRIPLSRGLYASIYAEVPHGASRKEVLGEMGRFYEGSPFVRTTEGVPDVNAVTYSNYAGIGCTVERGLAIVFVAIDNLGKGASSQAVQNMNVMFSFPEGEGLAGRVMFP